MMLMLKKDPVIKRSLIMLVISLIFIAFIIVLHDYFFVSRLPEQGIGSKFLLESIAIVPLTILLNVVLFAVVLKYVINKLENISLAVDRIMDGNFSVVSHVDEEGILSRLESQFCQMARRLQLSLDGINREKEKIKSLVTDISHQIRTPLASIKIFNSLLIDGGLTKEEDEEFLSRIKNEVDKLEWLANSLLKISETEQGIIQLKKEKADIRKTILEAVNGVYLEALEKNIEISMHNLESIDIDHDVKWTKEAIFNILQNAVKYTGEHGEVKISMEKLETYIKVDIEDNGIGIPVTDLGNIFNRFYRGDSTAVKKAEGSGVGLYLARKIIEEQGGGILVSSAEGQGSKFSVLLYYSSN
jgi:signal transduction histidine kinase